MSPLQIITKVVAYYSLFYAGVKIYGIVKGMLLLPNILIVMGLLALGLPGLWLIKKGRYYWWYALLGVLLISLLRYYEVELVGWFNDYFYQN